VPLSRNRCAPLHNVLEERENTVGKMWTNQAMGAYQELIEKEKRCRMLWQTRYGPLFGINKDPWTASKGGMKEGDLRVPTDNIRSHHHHHSHHHQHRSSRQKRSQDDNDFRPATSASGRSCTSSCSCASTQRTRSRSLEPRRGQTAH